MSESPDMQRSLPFPYPDGRFPQNLGAGVQRTVVAGAEPVRVVIHDADGDWVVGDGVNDPNLPGASVATHIGHVIARDVTVKELASMEPGWMAERSESHEAWRLSPHSYEQ